MVREGALLLFAALAVYLLLALATYDRQDPGWSYTGGEHVQNVGGLVGAWIADVLLFLFGYVAYLVSVSLGLQGWRIYRQKGVSDPVEMAPGWKHRLVRAGGFLSAFLSACTFATMYIEAPGLPESAGGILGLELAHWFTAAFSEVGTTVLLLSFLLGGITVWTNFSWLRLIDGTGRVALLLWEGVAFLWRMMCALAAWLYALPESRARKERDAPPVVVKRKKDRKQKRPGRSEPKIALPETRATKVGAGQISLFGAQGVKDLPPLDLLDESQEASTGYSEEELRTMSSQIELKLAEFGVGVHVVAVTPGPVVTRFDLETDPGIRSSKISSCARDLARAMLVPSVRVVEVVQGKSVVGLEVPNGHREMIRIRDILSAPAFQEMSSPTTVALGKDISGEPVVCDLAKMPHLLVAGATGSGKSVAVNTMILSFLYKALPMDLRLILIDPKMVELQVYQDIPHLLAPVITDIHQAAPVLSWCVEEMERRYRLMAKLGVRDLAGLNRKVREAQEKGTPLRDPTVAPMPVGEDSEEGPEEVLLEHHPFLVVVIDEFADIMVSIGKKVEEQLVRLAQKARAAGIHMVLATQRPSREVITGLIDANVPGRIALRVSSAMESRIILDQGGAEQLLGHGDILLLDPHQPQLRRVHGAFVSEDEVALVASHLREHGGAPQYCEEVTRPAPDLSLSGMGGEADARSDDLYEQAVEMVVRDRRASISYVQRRFKIGYNRAARLVEAMEETGIVGPQQANGSREVLVAEPE